MIHILTIVYRDVRERGRNLTNIIERYNKFVKPAYEEYIKPQRRYADVIIPHGAQNKIAIEFVSTNLKSELHKRISLEDKLRNNIEFLTHDVFDNRSFDNDKVHIITKENLKLNLKSILEDILNKRRPNYHK